MPNFYVTVSWRPISGVRVLSVCETSNRKENRPSAELWSRSRIRYCIWYVYKRCSDPLVAWGEWGARLFAFGNGSRWIMTRALTRGPCIGALWLLAQSKNRNRRCSRLIDVHKYYWEIHFLILWMCPDYPNNRAMSIPVSETELKLY